ncbi:MAG: class I SAM-dependent methyltransferase [Acidimicrobiia bacterium]
MPEPADANARWTEMLSRWAIPEELIAAAPEPPYFFDPQVFIDAADEALDRDHDTPSDAVARAALPAGGTVLDVACGAGAASLRLSPGSVVGVDPSRPLLDAFAERATRLAIPATTLEGVWPDTASQTPVSDVVVCHHILYNVTDLAAFAAPLDQHAHRRVVVELTAVHPMAWMAPYWKALYGLDQPTRPIAEDAVALLEALGLDVHEQRFQRRYQMIGENGEQSLQRIARRLCLSPARHDELADLLATSPPPLEREMVTLWW